MAQARGFDVSHWQPQVDWTRARRSGYAFAACKATEGASKVDQRLASHQRGIRGAGYLVGIYYHFARFGHPTIEADHALESVGELAGNERIALDLEGDDQAQRPADLIRFAEGFARRVLDRTGRSPVIYTSTRWWDLCGSPDSEYLRACPLWIKRYRAIGLGPGPLPRPWREWTIWQCTHNGDRAPRIPVPGVGADGLCDVNLFRGDEDALAEWAGRAC